MSNTAESVVGSVVSLRRYPVKSMMGEELNESDVTERGLLGDRAYALMDSSNGKIVSAKNPRKWPNLFEFGAAYVESPRSGERIPPVRITLPNGGTVTSDQDNIDRTLSRELDRDVTLEAVAPKTPSLEEYWPDIEGLDHREVVTDEAMPEGTFFDLAIVHILTTATLARLGKLYPQGQFRVRRFRPNILVRTNPDGDENEFPENDWIGKTVVIGGGLRLNVTGPCPRCVMTTLPQGGLPKDPGILRTAAQHNGVHVGVYASVLQGGTTHRGDSVRLE